MTARRTIERLLRDDDDASGQTLRQWKLERDGDHITVGTGRPGEWNIIRVADVPQLVADLQEIAGARE